MRIACNFANCAPAYIRQGFKHVFEKLGHTWLWHNQEQEPIIRMFDRFKPDIYLGETYNTTRATLKAIERHPECNVAMFCSAWGRDVNNVDRKQFPIDLVKDEERAILEICKKKFDQPKFVWLHLLDEDVERVIGDWATIGIKPVGILNAVDTYHHDKGNFRPELACDLFFCGGNWGYKGRNIKPYLYPLCHPSSKLSVRIFGNQAGWSVHNYFGFLADEAYGDFCASATIAPNLSEPHSTYAPLSYDLNDRIFKVIYSGGFCVSDNVAVIKRLFGDSVLLASSPSEFQDLVRYFVKNPEARLPYMEKSYKIVCNGHFYHHRTAKLLKELGHDDESDKCLQLLSVQG